VPTEACTAGEAVNHQPATTETTRNPAITPTVHHRTRWKASGRVTRKKRSTSCTLSERVPVRRLRASASTVDRRETSAGSGAWVRTTDRWPAVAW